METLETLREDIKSLICKIPDVMHCSINCDKSGKMQEIHVVASVGRNVKQLVRDIQSVIQAKFGIDIDYKIISVAQINEVEIKDTRMLIEEINVKHIGNTIEATVTLACEDQKYVGTSIKVKSQRNKFKAIAEATILATENYLGLDRGMYLEGMERIHIADRQVCVCMVGVAYNNKEEALVGSSIINADENEAVVKAVLAALNRRVSSMG